MQNKSTNTALHPSVLELMDEKIFEHHSVRDCMDDLEKMYFNYVCDENIENAYDRQTATVSFKVIHKALTCISLHKDPDDVVYCEIRLDL